MVGAGRALAQAVEGVEIDAVRGRQVASAIAILRARRDAGQLGDIVVVHIGNNGRFSARQFDELMDVLAGVPRVVLLNVKVPRRWEAPNNAVLADGARRYANVVLVDWRTASQDRPELFWKDGIHLRPAGARVYADLIAAAIGGAGETPYGSAP
jgi:lysophospholipase L1-like esterase